MIAETRALLKAVGEEIETVTVIRDLIDKVVVIKSDGSKLRLVGEYNVGDDLLISGSTIIGIKEKSSGEEWD